MKDRETCNSRKSKASQECWSGEVLKSSGQSQRRII